MTLGRGVQSHLVIPIALCNKIVALCNKLEMDGRRKSKPKYVSSSTTTTTTTIIIIIIITYH